MPAFVYTIMVNRKKSVMSSSYGKKYYIQISNLSSFLIHKQQFFFKALMFSRKIVKASRCSCKLVTTNPDARFLIGREELLLFGGYYCICTFGTV